MKKKEEFESEETFVCIVIQTIIFTGKTGRHILYDGITEKRNL